MQSKKSNILNALFVLQVRKNVDDTADHTDQIVSSDYLIQFWGFLNLFYKPHNSIISSPNKQGMCTKGRAKEHTFLKTVFTWRDQTIGQLEVVFLKASKSALLSCNFSTSGLSAFMLTDEIIHILAVRKERIHFSFDQN